MADEPIEFKSEKVNRFMNELSIRMAMIKARDMELAKLYSPIVFRDVIRHFEQEKGPDGPWQKWSRSYLQAIAGLVAFRTFDGNVIPITDDNFLEQNKPPRSPGKILQDKGHLRQSFRLSNVRQKAFGYEWFNPAKTKEGFPYAAAHNEGGDRLPKREFMYLSDQAIDQIALISIEFFFRG
jgi:phage gpG-like protein